MVCRPCCQVPSKGKESSSAVRKLAIISTPRRLCTSVAGERSTFKVFICFTLDCIPSVNAFQQRHQLLSCFQVVELGDTVPEDRHVSAHGSLQEQNSHDCSDHTFEKQNNVNTLFLQWLTQRRRLKKAKRLFQAKLHFLHRQLRNIRQNVVLFRLRFRLLHIEAVRAPNPA